MSTHEVVIALSFLHTTLTGSAELSAATPGGWWPDAVPSGKPTPFGLYGYVSAFDTNTSNGIRLITQPLYQVRVSGPATIIDQIAVAASLMDKVLTQGRNISVPGGLVSACIRESPLQTPTQVDGVTWPSIGGLYRIVLQQVPS